MMELIKSYLADFWVKSILIGSLLLNFGIVLFLYFSIKQNNLPATLHYNVYWGVDYLGQVHQLLILPLVGFIILIFNAFWGLTFWQKNRILSYYLIAVVLIVHIFLAISGGALWLVNR